MQLYQEGLDNDATEECDFQNSIAGCLWGDDFLCDEDACCRQQIEDMSYIDMCETKICCLGSPGQCACSAGVTTVVVAVVICGTALAILAVCFADDD